MPVKDLIKQEVKPKLLAEEISDKLTEAILEGRLKGGDQLVEMELQRIFNVSRTPVREAIRELEKKGLVDLIPRRGAFVRSVSLNDVQEVFPIRAALEGLAAGTARSLMTDRELQAMEAALDKMDQAARSQNVKAYRKHHIEFHELFIAGCRNNLLIKTIASLRMHSMWFQFSYRQYREDLDRSVAYHHQIMNLFRDPKAGDRQVEEAVRAHILAYLDMFTRFIVDQDLKEQDQTDQTGTGE